METLDTILGLTPGYTIGELEVLSGDGCIQGELICKKCKAQKMCAVLTSAEVMAWATKELKKRGVTHG